MSKTHHHTQKKNLDSSNKIQKSILTLVIIVTGVFIFIAVASKDLDCKSAAVSEDIQRVAHAGGGIDGETYTNSRQAMDSNYAKGFRYFEIDFSTTRDDNIVCVHDWARFRRLGGKDDLNLPLSFSEFEAINHSSYKHPRCTLDELVIWFGAHKDAFLVTDVKDHNLKSLKVIFDRIPNAYTVVIPQIYSAGEYPWFASTKVNRIIWTLYRSRITRERVLKKLAMMDRVFAITMPVSMAESWFPSKIIEQGVAVYVHTVNEPEVFSRLRHKFCVSEIYTDFLAPDSSK